MLLYGYGFAFENNTDDAVAIKLKKSAIIKGTATCSSIFYLKSTHDINGVPQVFGMYDCTLCIIILLLCEEIMGCIIKMCW